jgi:hypothetical protein
VHAHGLRFTGDPLPCLVPEGGEGLPECVVRTGPVELPELPVLAELRDTDAEAALRICGEPGRVTVWARGHGGGAVVEPGRLAVDLPEGEPWLRSRLLAAQVLPIAATLAGLECLHASAVELDGRTIAITAASGTGKSSVAWHLQALGARFVTDDVLAVDADLAAHPGPRLADVARREHDAAALDHPVLGRDDDAVHVTPAGATAPSPLAAVVVLTRDDAAVDSLPALLGATYLPWLRFPDRLARHLDVCARLSAGPVLRCTIAQDERATDVARRLLGELERL